MGAGGGGFLRSLLEHRTVRFLVGYFIRLSETEECGGGRSHRGRAAERLRGGEGGREGGRQRRTDVLCRGYFEKHQLHGW